MSDGERGYAGFAVQNLAANESAPQESDLMDRVVKLQRMNFDLQEELTKTKARLAAMEAAKTSPSILPIMQRDVVAAHSPTSAASALTSMPVRSFADPATMSSLSSDARSSTSLVMEALEHLAKQQTTASPRLMMPDPMTLLASLGDTTAVGHTPSVVATDESLAKLKNDLQAAMTAAALLNY